MPQQRGGDELDPRVRLAVLEEKMEDLRETVEGKNEQSHASQLNSLQHWRTRSVAVQAAIGMVVSALVAIGSSAVVAEIRELKATHAIIPKAGTH